MYGGVREGWLGSPAKHRVPLFLRKPPVSIPLCPCAAYALPDKVSLSKRNAGMKLPLLPRPSSPPVSHLDSRPLSEVLLWPFSHPHSHYCHLPTGGSWGLSMGPVSPGPMDRPSDTGRLRGPASCVRAAKQSRQSSLIQEPRPIPDASPLQGRFCPCKLQGWKVQGPL